MVKSNTGIQDVAHDENGGLVCMK